MVLSSPYSFDDVARMFGAVRTYGRAGMIEAIDTDTRTMRPGSLFVALSGIHCDGARFLPQAKKAKAACAVIASSRFDEAARKSGLALIIVDDVLSALWSFARAHLSRFSSVTYAGVTGSCGKTTTKEALASILSVKGPTAKTPGNLNSEIGLPLSVLSVGGGTRYGVFEMGVDHTGEMEHMLSVLTPDIGILTNIGNSHLEKFGNRSAIAREKGKLFHEGVDAGFIGRGCPYLESIEREHHVILRQYDSSSLRAVSRGLEGWDLSFGKIPCHINAVGAHLLSDIAGAVSVARFLGLSDEEIAEGLAGFTPMEGRSTVLSGDVTIIEDCYNASLDSTRSILDYVNSLSWKGNKKVVLGPMKELGSESKTAHEEVARRILRSDIRSTFLYGEEMHDAYRLLKASGWDGELSFTDDFDTLTDEVSSSVRRGDLFLVKGSRAATMERLLPVLKTAG